MKRNLFPLLGIAFVVAIAATGIFYGLFVGKINGAAPAPGPNAPKLVVAAKAVTRGQILKAEDVRLEPLRAERPEGAFSKLEDVVGRTATEAVGANEAVTAGALMGGKSGAMEIPKGMRAISVRASDSVGLLPFVKAGQRVDVQAIETHSGESSARTLLTNVEVLNVHVDPVPQQSPATVLNLLVPARDVERVALADSAGKVRIVLRGAGDTDDVPVVPAGRQPVADAGPRVSFQVRMAAAGTSAAREIVSRAGLAADGAVRIGLLPADWKAEQLEKAGGLRVLSNESVDSGQWQEVSLQAGGAKPRDYDLRLRLMPRGAGKGMVRLRVRPELTLPQQGGLSSRGFSADLNVADGQSVLVAGFERDAAVPALVEKLFRSSGPEPGSELLMVVTPRMSAAR